MRGLRPGRKRPAKFVRASTAYHGLLSVLFGILLGVSLALPTGAFAASADPVPGANPPISLTVGKMHFQPTVTLARQFAESAPAVCSPYYSGFCSNLTYHSGPVMNVPNVYLIFWLPTGDHFETDATGDQNYENLIERYFTDVSVSSMHNILSQYYSSDGTTTTYPVNNSLLAGEVLDTTPYPHAGTPADPIMDSDLQTRISADITAEGWPTGVNNLYFIYTGNGIQSCYISGDCSQSQYCAYHSAFYQNSTPIIYANQPDVYTFSDCTLGGAFPNDPYADQTISVGSHEYFEASSDPLLNAWYDQSTSGEIGDQCNFSYGNENAQGANVTLNGNPYQVQLEWDNSTTNCETSYTGQFINFTPDPSTNHTYGDTLTAQATSLLPVTLVNQTPSTCVVSVSQVRLTAAKQTCTVQASQAGGGFYGSAAPVNLTLFENPAALTVTAPSLTFHRGSPLPTLTPTYAGFVNGDTVTSLTAPATCATTATIDSPLGQYPVTCSGASAVNYTFSYIPGTLTNQFKNFLPFIFRN